MKTYTFDAWITVEAKSRLAAADFILEGGVQKDMAIALFKKGTLNKPRKRSKRSPRRDSR